VPVIAKLEKPEAIENLEAIVLAFDAIMVARGDLGVELPLEEVPLVQKRVIQMARENAKPVIVATQMLESMIENAAPTRAEAGDVATAVFDGADAVMLSAETATGKYPLEAVGIMDRICQNVEKSDMYRSIMDADHPDSRINDAGDAITGAADQVACDIKAACITTYTTSGSTALRTVRLRPAMKVLVLTQNLSTARRLCVSYGVHAVQVEEVSTFADAVILAQKHAKAEGLADVGQRFVMTAGVPFGTPGSTNILRVAWIE